MLGARWAGSPDVLRRIENLGWQVEPCVMLDWEGVCSRHDEHTLWHQCR